MIVSMLLLAALGVLPGEDAYPKLHYADDVERTNRTGVVVIDPGHGGESAGAIGPGGLQEKEANLAIAREVKRALLARGFNAVMTREGDESVDLFDRPKIACALDADAFISIHHNAPPEGVDPMTCRYTAVYAWNAIGEKLARAISARVSATLADEMESRGVLHANFVVTRNPEIPSCLVEVDFITSPEGERAARNVERRRRIAEAIASGFADWTQL